MNWKALLLGALHAAGGAAAGAAGAVLMPALPVIPTLIHVDPLTGAIIGSALSSLASAFMPPPNQVGSPAPSANPPAK